jgi:hypothetical protein
LISDKHICLSIRLQAAFGLRREEAIKFSPSYAVQDDHIKLKASWTKGGRTRTVPIRTDDRRRLLQEVEALTKGSAFKRRFATAAHTISGRYLAHRMNEIRQATVYGIRPTRTFKQTATKYLNDYQHKKSLERDVYAFKCIVPHIGRPVARTGSRPEPLTKS